MSLVHQKLKKKERKTDLSSVSVFLVYLLRNFCEELIVYASTSDLNFLKKKRAMDKLTASSICKTSQWPIWMALP